MLSLPPPPPPSFLPPPSSPLIQLNSMSSPQRVSGTYTNTNPEAVIGNLLPKRNNYNTTRPKPPQHIQVRTEKAWTVININNFVVILNMLTVTRVNLMIDSCIISVLPRMSVRYVGSTSLQYSIPFDVGKWRQPKSFNLKVATSSTHTMPPIYHALNFTWGEH